MTGVRIRPATAADEAFVAALVPSFAAAGLPPWREPAGFLERVEDDVRGAVLGGGTVLVAESAAGEPLGFVHLHAVADMTGGRRGHVSDLAVAERARGQGVGAALVAAAEEWAAARGHRLLGLNVLPANVRAQRFYERLGFGPDSISLVKPVAGDGAARGPRADRRALLVIDVQRGFDDAGYWGRRDNPDCERNVERLIAAARARGDAVVFVRHDSRLEDSPLRPGQSGNAFKDCVTGEPDLLVVKTVNSALLGRPALGSWLDEQGICGLDVCGITTNHCCETTARMAGNLGYDVRFVIDATHAFDRAGVPAEQLRRVTAVNLDGEFARVVETGAVVAG